MASERIPVTVTNQYTHDEDGHPYSFSLQDGVLCVNGMKPSTWLAMARNICEDMRAGRNPTGGLPAAINYILKAEAALINKAGAPIREADHG